VRLYLKKTQLKTKTNKSPNQGSLLVWMRWSGHSTPSSPTGYLGHREGDKNLAKYTREEHKNWFTSFYFFGLFYVQQV
jgi:hypothetical protein